MNYTLIIFFSLCTICVSQELAFVSAFESKIYFEPPNEDKWEVLDNSMKENKIYVLSFIRNPLIDSLGREIKPVMSILIEQFKDSIDVINYSFLKRRQISFKIDEVIPYDIKDFHYRNVIGYKGHYKKVDDIHDVFVIHMIDGRIGVQIICESTRGVFKQVENDMRRFFKFVGIHK